MKRIMLIFIFLLALASISAVTADENSTDLIADEKEDISALQSVDNLSSEVDDTLAEQSNEDIVKENESGDVKTTSQITASAVSGYEASFIKITFKLTSGGKPLASKNVTILLDGLTYDKTTNRNGEGSISVLLMKGTYYAKFSYEGDNSTTSAEKTSKVTVKSPTKTNQ